MSDCPEAPDRFRISQEQRAWRPPVPSSTVLLIAALAPPRLDHDQGCLAMFRVASALPVETSGPAVKTP
jgi:hypothetical protein